jgi:hypothetical protein
VIGLALIIAGCSGSGGSGVSVSVFSIESGQCFLSPTKVHAQLSSVQRTPCSRPHNQEAYATVPYKLPNGRKASAYPGDEALSKFAQGACAQRFAGYVGIDYIDSKLFFTYLMPSARSWETDDDQNVICFVTTAGGTLTGSVKDSRK